MKSTIKNYLCNFLLAFLLTGLCGCISPEVRFSKQAEKFNFEKKIVMGTEFEHRVYIKSSASAINNTTIHIYLDGDGSPWINHRWVSSDPTPRNPLLLRLMRHDQHTSVYIGRPCYFGLNQYPACAAKLWTSHRYSPAIINSMAAVVNSTIKYYQAKHIILIAYSGGGALAVLMAEQLPKITGIITIAANLDINAWTEYHGYSALSGSLNPAEQRPLTKNIFQLHLAGGKDNNIMLKHIKSYAKKQYRAQVSVFANYDHHCCWEEIWPAILSSIDIYATQSDKSR